MIEEKDYINTYFEAGKVSSVNIKNYFVLSFFLATFLALPDAKEINVPIINNKIEYSTSIMTILLAHSFLFFRAISSINHERVLRSKLANKGNIENINLFRISYPSIVNYIQFSEVFANKKYYNFSLVTSLILLLCVSIAMPFAAVFLILVKKFSFLALGLASIAALVYMSTFVFQMKNFNKYKY
jgi:hypothetical protein